jgi:hypothetical protein
MVKLPSLQKEEGTLKATTEKYQCMYKGKHIKITSDFSAEMRTAMKAQNDIFQDLKENNCQPRLLYRAKLFFKIDGKIENFQEKYNLKKYVSTKPALQKILIGISHTEEEERQSKI